MTKNSPGSPALLFLQAHPDDECILTGSTLAKSAAAGIRTIVVYGTRGDEGETKLDLGDETLGERRVREATAACADLDVSRIEWLPYDDSGMADTETTANPNAFSNADPAEVAGRLVELLDDEHIVAVIGYDKNGTYGHPDHKQVHHVAHVVAPDLGAAYVLDATYDRDYLATLPDSDGSIDPDYASGAAELTHFVTGDEWLDRKFKAVSNHTSQVPDDVDLDAPVSEFFKQRFETEWFIAVQVEGSERDASALFESVLVPKAEWSAK